jgi:putative acetyltransferase
MLLKMMEKIMGSGWQLAPLETKRNQSQAQKMYFRPETRGLGIGGQMIAKCMEVLKNLVLRNAIWKQCLYVWCSKLYKKQVSSILMLNGIDRPCILSFGC